MTSKDDDAREQRGQNWMQAMRRAGASEDKIKVMMMWMWLAYDDGLTDGYSYRFNEERCEEEDGAD